VWAPGDVVEEATKALVHQVGNASGDAMLSLHAYSPALPVDAPSPRAGRNVVVIGGGLSGAAVAYHLLRRGDSDLRIALVERGPLLGRGVAYGVDSEVYRLNVPASKMSLDPERPTDFVGFAGAEADPSAYLPRAKYGAYVSARFADAVREGRPKLRVVRGEAVAVDARSVHLADGTALPADVVVLATGIAPRLSPSALPDDPRVLDAWDECAVAALPRDGDVLVLGAGLTALDVVAMLDAHGFRGRATILSRRGLLPRPHLVAPGVPAPLSRAAADAAPRDLRGLIRWTRAHVQERVAGGEAWQLAVDALRPHVSRLYRGLPPEDRARFVRKVRPYWDVIRHRAPADALARVDAWRAEDRLEVLAGRVASCVAGPHALEVELDLLGGPRRARRFDRIVRCIGPALERCEVDAPLVHSLIAGGIAAADPAGLGIVTDEEGCVVGPAGAASDRIFALGALRRASSWETTAVPDIAAHAHTLARHIVG
jgi:uncharacterized NAD(P)/FAD-binding protein YdhS